MMDKAILLNLPNTWAKALDELAIELGENRNELIRVAIRDFLKSHDKFPYVLKQ